MSYLFKFMSVILIIAFIDQLYMLNQYGNISRETVFFTFCLMLMSINYVFLVRRKQHVSRRT